MVEPLEYPQFISLVKSVDVILTDSGGVQEEAAYFGKPLVVLRNETERSELLEDAIVRISGYDPTHIFTCTRQFLNIEHPPNRNVCVFGDGNAADRIIGVLYRWEKKRSPLLPFQDEFHLEKQS